MRFKLLIAFVENGKSDTIMAAAREAGATGATVISNARGEGLKAKKTFLGLTLEAQRDIVLMLVEQHLARTILECISRVGEFDTSPGTGMVLQLDVEDALGVAHQIKELSEKLEEHL